MINLQELRDRATAARGASWTTYGDTRSLSAGVRNSDGKVICGGDKYEGHFAGANAEFVAAANPHTVLQLIDEIDSLRAAIARNELESQTPPTRPNSTFRSRLVALVPRAQRLARTLRGLTERGAIQRLRSRLRLD